MPTSKPVFDWNIIEIRDGVRSGDISAVEVCQASLDRIDVYDPIYNAMTAVFHDEALEQAAAIDRLAKSDRSDRPLLGIPVTIKDVICSRGQITTAASRILKDFRPPYDATVVTRLKQAGAIIIGKTNCDEFAMGSSTEHSAYGPTKNPWDIERSPGGSSGGAAAAVAAQFAPVSIGTDTGGSIRQPAAFCGVVGLKPTYGRVSRYGLLAFASSFDQIGPLANSVEDAALILQVIAGVDPADATSVAQSVPDYSTALKNDIRGTRIGVPRAMFEHADASIDKDVLRAYDSALDIFTAAGAELVDITLPHAAHAVPTYYLAAPAEASSNLARYDGVRYGLRASLDEAADTEKDLAAMYDRTRNSGFGTEVKRRIMLGTYALSAGYYDAYYGKAQQVRSLIRLDYDDVFAGANSTAVDVVAMPTTPTAAFKLGEHEEDPLTMYLGDIFTVSANLTGLPALSVPAGLTTEQLPIGLQLIGRAFNEDFLLRLAHVYEQATPWHDTRPTLKD